MTLIMNFKHHGLTLVMKDTYHLQLQLVILGGEGLPYFHYTLY